jgi:hypothetical protein
MRHWSGMLIQSGGSKPFVVSLMEILADEFPFIIFKMGGFVDRDIRGKPGVKSMHASGRAIDIYLSVREPQEKALGKLLYGMFKDNAASAHTGHVIFDGLTWSPGNTADRSTRDAGIRDVHDDHVHVDFDTAGIAGTAHHLIAPIRLVRHQMEQRYKEWLEGYYGPAFNPTSNNTHLSTTERQAIYNVNKGVTSMSLAPEYLKAVERAIKWRAAGKLPGPADAI